MTIKDTNGDKTPINYKDILPDTNMSVNPFGQNRAAEIAYRKIERLTLATHLVTNFVPKSENVRENIRARSQKLLTLVMELREGFESTGSDSVHRITAHVRQILSLLDITHASGYISTMNLEVLKGAYADLVRFLEKSQGANASEGFELDESHFVSVSAKVQGQISQGQNKSLKDKSVKDIVTDIKKSEVVTDKNVINSKRPKSLRAKRRATSRRMVIIDMITKRGALHIKDIAAEITDCSEKTIQRELVSLVKDGVLKKEGTKRWTTYSLLV